jgi:hypothetical protein
MSEKCLIDMNFVRIQILQKWSRKMKWTVCGSCKSRVSVVTVLIYIDRYLSFTVAGFY